MPFRIRNGPSIFQRLTAVLLYHEKECTQNYIDVVIVFSGSWADHMDQWY